MDTGEDSAEVRTRLNGACSRKGRTGSCQGCREEPESRNGLNRGHDGGEAVSTIENPLALQLANWITSVQTENLPQAVLDSAKIAFADWIACVLLGSASPEASSVYHGSAVLGKGEDSSLIVYGGKTTAYIAALVHGTMAHSLDFDDTLLDCAIHTGASVCSAAFAAAEREGASGSRLLEGIVVGYELAGRVGKASNRVPARGASSRGFHPTGICGVFATSAAVSRIMNVDAITTANGLGIAGSLASGIREYSTAGSMTKRIHPALAASHGILCAELARRGLTGPLSVFEGPNGFLRAYSESPEVHYLTTGLGDDFEITKRSAKYYPCCHINHTAIDILLDLHREGLRAEDVEKIEVFLAPAGFQIVAHPMDEKRVPETPLSSVSAKIQPSAA